MATYRLIVGNNEPVQYLLRWTINKDVRRKCSVMKTLIPHRGDQPRQVCPPGTVVLLQRADGGGDFETIWRGYALRSREDRVSRANELEAIDSRYVATTLPAIGIERGIQSQAWLHKLMQGKMEVVCHTQETLNPMPMYAKTAADAADTLARRLGLWLYHEGDTVTAGRMMDFPLGKEKKTGTKNNGPEVLSVQSRGGEAHSIYGADVLYYDDDGRPTHDKIGSAGLHQNAFKGVKRQYGELSHAAEALLSYYPTDWKLMDCVDLPMLFDGLPARILAMQAYATPGEGEKCLINLERYANDK